MLLWWETARDDRIVRAGRDHWKASGPSSPVPKHLGSSELAKLQTAAISVWVTDALVLLRMLQSSGAFLLTLCKVSKSGLS